MKQMEKSFLSKTFSGIAANFTGLVGLGVIYKFAPILSFGALSLALTTFLSKSEVIIASSQVIGKPTIADTASLIVRLSYIMPDSLSKWSIIGITLFANVLVAGMLQGGILRYILGGLTCAQMSSEFFKGIREKGLRMVGFQTLQIMVLLAIQGIAYIVMVVVYHLLPEGNSIWNNIIIDLSFLLVVITLRSPIILAPYFYFEGETFLDSLAASLHAVRKRFWTLYAAQALSGVLVVSLFYAFCTPFATETGAYEVLSLFISLLSWSLFAFTLLMSGVAYREYVTGKQKGEL